MSIQRPWVTPEEIRSVAYGLFLGEDEAAELEGPIRFAENKILAKKALRVEQRLRAGTLDVETVKGVVIDMVLRVVKNPGGVQSDSLGSSSTSYFRGAASGVIELLDEDIEILRPRQKRVGMIRVGVPSWRIP